jgi:molecular chaperone GrpE
MTKKKNDETKPENKPESNEDGIPVEMISSEELEQLKEEVEAQKKTAAENFDGWQRERADFVNYKKRMEKDQIMLRQNITGEIVKKYLPVMDDLERALKVKPEDGEGAKWSEGIDLIYRKLGTILENEGVKRMDAENAEFDPTVHEAISHEPSESHESGQVIEVVQQGYKLGERVLRPALVRVAK